MRSLILGLSAAVSVLAVFPELASAAPSSGATAVVEPARRPDAVVVTYREILGEIGDPDRGPTLRVFGDGRMVAHYPHYMKRGGDYEQRLAPGELDQLLQSLANKGLLDFDAAATRTAAGAARAAGRQRALAANAPVTVFEAVDAATTVIEVTVDRYQSSTPGARAIQHLTKRVVWTGLRSDAQHYPDVPALRDLAAAEQELRALRERPGFARVP